MKRILLAIFALYIVYANAQSNDRDISRITIHAVMPEYNDIPNEFLDILETKLSEIITDNGIEDNEYSVRFVLTAKVKTVSKDIVVGPPQRISQKINITFILGDILEDKVFARKTITVVGIGASEEKAFNAAFLNIKPENKEISQFIQDGKQKILSFYQTHCEDMIAEAKSMATQNQYEQAILTLSSIPDISSDCFTECIQLIETIYMQMITVRGEELLVKAQNTWAKNPTRQGAHQATQYLQQINHAAPCQTEVSKLLDQITEKMNEIDCREWQHEMQVYQDKIERERREWNQKVQVYRDNVEREKREWEQHVQEHKDRVETQRQYINAARDVAIEYARHQPKEVNYYHVNYSKIYSW